MAFKKGGKRPLNSGKKKGTENLVTRDAKETFIKIMEGEVDFIKDSFTKVRLKDPARYLDCLAKLMPYFIPKQMDLTSKGKELNPMIIDWTGTHNTSNTEAEGST